MSHTASDLTNFSYAQGPECLTDNAAKALFALIMNDLDARSFFQKSKDMLVDLGWISRAVPDPEFDRELRGKLFGELGLDALTPEARATFLSSKGLITA